MNSNTSPLSASAPCTADRGRAREILSRLACDGLQRHGFGMKTSALQQCATKFLASAESLAWSLRVRFAPPLPSCTHQRCSSYPGFALRWLQNIEPEVHRSATKAGVRRAYRLGLDLGRPSGHHACENGSVEAGKHWGLRRTAGQECNSNEQDASLSRAARGMSLSGSTPAIPRGMVSAPALAQAHRPWPVRLRLSSGRNCRLAKWGTLSRLHFADLVQVGRRRTSAKIG